MSRFFSEERGITMVSCGPHRRGKRAWLPAAPVILLLVSLSPLAHGAVAFTIDGSQTNQVIDGFGVNANYYNWTNAELVPVIDALIDQAGMTLFRVIFNNGWEDSNDNNDPDIMNWTYYNALYSGPEFEKLWSLMGYLNQKGITNGLVLNFQGRGPSWMGGYSLDPGEENEWAEMVASLVIYARTNRHLQFNLLAPNNEPNITGEGIQVQSADQYVQCLHILAQLLDANGMADIRFVAPDLSGGETDFFPEIMADTLVMSKMAHFGIHSYAGNGGGSQGVYDFVAQAGYPDRTVWVTEYNVWCSRCEAGVEGTNDWDYALGTAQYLAGHLENNVSAGLVWEGYDSWYPHHGSWSFWGLMGVDDIYAVPRTWTPRHNFYTLAQFARFVRPGARRMDATGGSSDVSIQAFFNDASGQLSLVGFNTGASATTISGTLSSVPAPPALDMYCTTASNHLFHAATVAVSNNQFSASLPPDAVFTLTGFDPAKALLSVSLSSPTNGARFYSPAVIPVQAQVVTGTGAVMLVEFFSNTNRIGGFTNEPYSLTWSNVQLGIYSLTARASNSAGIVATSPAIEVRVVGPFAQIVIQPTNSLILPSATQQFIATAADAFGTHLDVQPAFSWALNGGGTISSNGLLKAAAGIGGPFVVEASARNVIGLATFVLSTNLAREGSGFTWYSLGSPYEDSPRVAAAGINDGDFIADIPLLSGGGVEQSLNVYEAGGIIWTEPRTISRAVWHNGGFSALGDGVFCAAFGLQFSPDGVTWNEAGPAWILSPAYPYDSSAAAGRAFVFSGGPVSVRGFRCAGLVHISDSSGSWAASAQEIEAFASATLPQPQPDIQIVSDAGDLSVRWDGWARDYALQSSTNLDLSSNWMNLTNAPAAFGGAWQVRLPLGPGPRFFRLRHP